MWFPFPAVGLQNFRNDAWNVIVKDNTESVYKKNFGRKPRCSHIKILGCAAHSKNRDAIKKNFNAKLKCLFIENSDTTTTYL